MNKQLGTFICNTKDIAPSNAVLYNGILETDADLHMPFETSVIQDTKSIIPAINVNNVTLDTYRYPLITSTSTKTGANFTGTLSNYLNLDNKINQFKNNSILTVSFFIYIKNTTGGPEGIFSIKDGSQVGAVYRIFINGNKISFSIHDNVGTRALFCIFNGTNALNVWYHIVITIGDSGVKIYNNGVDITTSGVIFTTGDSTTTICVNDFPNMNSCYIGSMHSFALASNISAGIFNQVLSDFFIFDRVLNALEINSLYEEGYPKRAESGNMNASRSQLQFYNMNLYLAIGPEKYEKHNKFKLKLLNHKYEFNGDDNNKITEDKNIDIYMQGLPVYKQEYRSNGFLNPEIYTHSVLNNDFTNAFNVDLNQFSDIEIPIIKQQLLNLTVNYRDSNYTLKPSEPTEIYPHTMFKFGIYPYDD